MEAITNERDLIDLHYNYFTRAILPYGSGDISRAIKIALDVEEDGDWLAELVNECAEQCEIKIGDIDVIAVVYESILETARGEIEDLTQFDFVNDGAEVSVFANYLDSRYTYNEDSPNIIKKKLKRHKVIFDDLSIKTKYFLNKINANY